MKLAVPTNWQPDLVKRIKKPGVDVVYGKLNSDFVGGGRPACTSPEVRMQEAKKHVKEIHDNGLKFNYLLNAACLGNHEWTIRGQRRLRKLLTWLTDIKADGVVVSVPYLAQFIRKNYPHFTIVASCLALVDSVEKAIFWEDLGANVITMSQHEMTRDFKLLREIKSHVKCELQLIVNDNCIKDCPFYIYHHNLIAHSSQNFRPAGIFVFDYCRFFCRYKILSEPGSFIKAAWIRPEDISVYEGVGINRFKVVDRNMTSDAISFITDAYSKRSYNGNLYDLFGNPSKSLWFKKFDPVHRLKYFFHPFKLNVFKLMKMGAVLKDLEVFIDNTKLGGFIDYFLKNESCRYKACSECGYCKNIEESVVTIAPGYREEIASQYGHFIDESVSGAIFKY